MRREGKEKERMLEPVSKERMAAARSLAAAKSLVAKKASSVLGGRMAACSARVMGLRMPERMG